MASNNGLEKTESAQPVLRSPRQVLLHQWGNAAQLVVAPMSLPTVTAGCVLVKIHYAALNPIDFKIRNGRFKWFMNSHFPKVLGLEGSGTVVACGAGVTDFQPNDTVYLYTGAKFRMGCYADYACVPATEIVLLPPHFDLQAGAGLSVAPVTALQVLRDKARIGPGMNILINGASGAVGACAVQLAKKRGAQVTGVCSTRNIERVRSWGADRVIDYTCTDFTQENIQYDLVFDCVSTRTFSECKKILTPKVQYINLMLRPMDLIAQRLNNLFSQKKFHTALLQFRTDDVRAIITAVQSSDLHIPIDRVFALDAVQDAHRYQEDGRAVGKVLLGFSP